MSERRIRAFVTDGDERPALAITRSLGRRGVEVLVGHDAPASLAGSSRYCARTVTYPSPSRCPKDFERFLQALVERERIDVVFPVTDVTTHLIARNEEALRARTALAAPSFEAFEVVTNKWTLIQRAAGCGIRIPRTHLVQDIAGLRAVLAQIEYPAVVKPARSRTPTDLGWVAGSAHYANSEPELVRLYRETEYLASAPSLIQERIVGPGLGLFVLCERGRLVAAFAHRRLREKPPSGGVSVLCESVDVDSELRDRAMQLLGRLGWHGVAMLEFKQDRRTGRAVLIEINGRFWGSLQLAIDAGVDFPFLSCQLALGRRLDVPPPYKVGVRSRWLLGDLDHLLIRLRHGRRDLPHEAPSRWRALIEFLKLAQPGLRYETYRRDDPRPALHEIREYIRALSESATALAGGRGRPPAVPAALRLAVAADSHRGSAGPLPDDGR